MKLLYVLLIPFGMLSLPLFAQQNLILHGLIGAEIDKTEQEFYELRECFPPDIWPSLKGNWNIEKGEKGRIFLKSGKRKGFEGLELSQQLLDCLGKRISDKASQTLEQLALLAEKLEVDSPYVVFKYLRGNERRGQVMALDSDSLWLKYRNGKTEALPLDGMEFLFMAGSQIDSHSIAPKAKPGLHSFSNRFLLTQSAIPGKKGEFIFQNTLALYNKLQFSLTDHVTVGGGFYGPAPVGEFYASLPLGKNICLGGEVHAFLAQETFRRIWINGTLTVGNRRSNLSLKGGYVRNMIPEPAKRDWSPGMGLAYSHQLRKNWRLYMEHLSSYAMVRSSEVENEKVELFSIMGVRYQWNKFAVDGGVMGIMTHENQTTTWPNEESIRSTSIDFFSPFVSFHVRIR